MRLISPSASSDKIPTVHLDFRSPMLPAVVELGGRPRRQQRGHPNTNGARLNLQCSWRNSVGQVIPAAAPSGRTFGPKAKGVQYGRRHQRAVTEEFGDWVSNWSSMGLKGLIRHELDFTRPMMESARRSGGADTAQKALPGDHFFSVPAKGGQEHLTYIKSRRSVGMISPLQDNLPRNYHS